MAIDKDFLAKVMKPGLGDSELKTLLKSKGIPIKHFTGPVTSIGIVINDPDGLSIEYEVPKPVFGGFVDQLTADDIEDLSKVEIFPLGTVVSDRFRIKLEVGKIKAK